MSAPIWQRAILVASFLIIYWPTLVSAQDQPRFTLPDPVIKIPGLSDFTEPAETFDEQECPQITDETATSCLLIPWIGQYVASLYRFAVLASTVLAVVVLMVAGYLWLTAGGNVNQIGQAKTYIGGALTGLALMLGSYTILSLVNPRLVRFDALRLPLIKRIPLGLLSEQLGGFSGRCSVTQVPPGLEPAVSAQLANSFNQAGASYGLDPFLLTAFARRESTFNPTGNNKETDAFGIMQLIPTTAEQVWNLNIHQPPLPPPAECRPPHEPDPTIRPYGKRYRPECKTYLQNNPDVQIRLGAAYLTYLNGLLSSKDCNGRSCGGDVALLAAAYHAGPGKAEKLIDGQARLSTWPITQNYVADIQSIYRHQCSTQGGAVLEDPRPTPLPRP